jgi:hypothetical protein
MDTSSRRAVMLVLLGQALFLLGRSVEGWLRGLCQGAAVALLVLGVLALARSRRGAGWLPSRDGEDR